MKTLRRGLVPAGLVGILVLGSLACSARRAPELTAAPRAPTGWLSLTSNASELQLALHPRPDSMPLSQLFDMELRILQATQAERPSIAVEAVMPEHRHGMNVVPQVRELGLGHFEVEGMLLHMPGRWELHVDVTRGPYTERFQCDVVLE